MVVKSTIQKTSRNLLYYVFSVLYSQLMLVKMKSLFMKVPYKKKILQINIGLVYFFLKLMQFAILTTKVEIENHTRTTFPTS